MLRHSAGFEHTYLPDAEVILKQIGEKKVGRFEPRITANESPPKRWLIQTCSFLPLLVICHSRKNRNKHCSTLLKEGSPSSVFTMRQTLFLIGRSTENWSVDTFRAIPGHKKLVWLSKMTTIRLLECWGNISKSLMRSTLSKRGIEIKPTS